MNCSCRQIAHTCKTANFVILLAMTQQGDTVTALISPVREKEDSLLTQKGIQNPLLLQWRKIGKNMGLSVVWEFLIRKTIE